MCKFKLNIFLKAQIGNNKDKRCSEEMNAEYALTSQIPKNQPPEY